MTPPENDLRDAVADQTLRREVRDCIGETIPLRRRWVSAIIAGPITRLLARTLAAEADLAKARADLERVTAERDAAMADKLTAEEYAVTLISEKSTAEAENTRLRALLVDAGEALKAAEKRFTDIAAGRAFQPRPHAAAGSLEALAALRPLAALDKAPTPKEPA